MSFSSELGGENGELRNRQNSNKLNERNLKNHGSFHFFLFISFCRGLIFRCHGSTSGVFLYTFLSTEHDVFRVVSKFFWVLHFFENDEAGNPYETHVCPENMTDDEGNARATYSFTCTGQFAKCLKCFVNIPSLKQ